MIQTFFIKLVERGRKNVGNQGVLKFEKISGKGGGGYVGNQDDSINISD